MTEPVRRRTAVEIPWGTILKLIAAAALVWIGLQLVQLVLVVVVAVLLAVTFNPIVGWLERHGWPRWGGALVIGVAIVSVLGIFGFVTWTSISSEAQDVGTHLAQIERDAFTKMPVWARKAIGVKSGDEIPPSFGPYALRVVQSAITAVIVGVLGFILTLYLMIEGERTRDWLLAFVPPAHRARAAQTITESERVIFAYVAGNVITSMLAALFVGVALSILNVPAALLHSFIPKKQEPQGPG